MSTILVKCLRSCKTTVKWFSSLMSRLTTFEGLHLAPKNEALQYNVIQQQNMLFLSWIELQSSSQNWRIFLHVGSLLRKGTWWTSGVGIPMGLWPCCGAICRLSRWNMWLSRGHIMWRSGRGQQALSLYTVVWKWKRMKSQKSFHFLNGQAQY